MSNNKPKKIKEIKLHPNIEDHDFNVKLKKIVKLLTKGHICKVAVIFRGRELSHPEYGKDLLDIIIGATEAIASPGNGFALKGKQMLLTLQPLGKRL